MTRFFAVLLCLFAVSFAQEDPKESNEPKDPKPEEKKADDEKKPEEKKPEEEKPEEAEKQVTESGLTYWVLEEGKADTKPVRGDRVVIHYTGWLEDGRKFDSTRDPGRKPLNFPVGVGFLKIAGLDEGVRLMNAGAKYKLLIPAKLAFGGRRLGVIPANANLVMEVELVEVIKGEPIPDFRQLDVEKAQLKENGLKVEVLAEGEGEAPKAGQCVKYKFVLWNGKGELVMCTQVSKMHIAGFMDKCNLPRLPDQFRPAFLKDVVAMMKVGSRALYEVPPGLCWGPQALSAKLPGNSTTFWQIEMVKIYEAPKFVLTAEDKLTKTESGLMYEVIKEGTGAKPGPRDMVSVFYTGWTPDGKLFDSAHVRDDPSTFRLDGVIRGWTEGLQLMKEGAVYRFTIPGNLAYGDTPKRPGAPAGKLIFLVEFLKIVK